MDTNGNIVVKGNQNEVIPMDADSVLSVNTVALVESIDGVYSDVKKAADKIVGISKIDDLGEAANLLLGIQDHMKDLKSSENFIVKKAVKSLRKFQTYVEWQIKKRQSIKTGLEKTNVEYIKKRNALKNGIEDVENLKEETEEVTQKIVERLNNFQMEINCLEEFSQSVSEEDTNKMKKVNNAIMIRQTLIADLISAKTINEATIVDVSMQLEEREALFTKLGSIIPMINSLTSQQLAILQSRKPIADATEAIKKSKENLRNIVKHSSREARESAVETAKALYDPILDDETINEVANNIIGMCDDTKVEIQKSINKQRSVIETAKEASERIKQKLIETAKIS